MKSKFQGLGIVSQNIVHLSAKEAFELCTNHNAILVDVREEYMLGSKMFDVKEMIYCPYSSLSENFEKFDNERILIFADAVGLKSKESVIFMQSKGFENIANLAGGIVDWDRDNFPIHNDFSKRLSGQCMCQLKYRENKK